MGDCILFVDEKTSKNCYLGHLNNVDTDFLTTTGESQDPQGVYLNLNTIGKLSFSVVFCAYYISYRLHI